ncbi:hypothetical protein BKA70DRAFT_1361895 [Coprinopsis sp. MPI-PUGE-AT-0042]|nr:hypothetical protein BKA70DRAFT_1361895 [Coprinopsis sp. MPI-PUGE-AT-0042]
MTSAKGSGVPPPSLLLEAKNELAQGNEAQFGSTATTKHAEGIPDESGSPRSISTQLQPEHSKLAQASISWRFVPRRSQISARGGALTQDDAIAGTSGISTKFGRGDPITVRSNTVSRTSARTHTAKDQMTGGASANTREAKGKTAAGSNMHARAQVPHNSPSLRYITTAVTPQGHLGRQLPTTFTGSHDGDEATISDSHVKAFKIICQSICGGSAIITATASSDGKFMAIASLQNGGTTVMLGHALGLSKGSAEQAAALAACRSLYEQYPGQILLSQDKTFIPAKASTGEYSLIS